MVESLARVFWSPFGSPGISNTHNAMTDPSPQDITAELQQANDVDDGQDKAPAGSKDINADTLQIKNMMSRGLWMPRPVIKTKAQLEGLGEGLEYLIPLNRMYIYPRIKMIDGMFVPPLLPNPLLNVALPFYRTL